MILEEEFIDILIQYGHNVYLRRRRDVSGTGPYMVVDGGKYETNLERWTSYRVLKTGQWPARYLDPRDEGLTSDADAVFYFQATCAPKESDLVIENMPNTRKARYVYEVKQAIPYWLGNTVIYYAAFCMRKDPVAT